MRDTQFREWLSRRRFQGKPLSTVSNRVAWCRNVEKALPQLGFAETDLDALHAAGSWDTLLKAMSKLRSDWRNNEAAARAIAPQSQDPRLQMANARSSVGMYGRFANGDDPNYDDEGEEEGEVEVSGRPFLLFDATGAAFKPVRNGNRTTGRSSFRVKPPGANNEADQALEVDTIAEVARAMLIDRLPARVQSVHGGQVNYLVYGGQRLVRYELDPAIAAEIGVPSTDGIREASGVITDEEILARFNKKAAFAEWWANWTLADRDAFFRLVRATHAAGLDWYHLKMAHQVRCGRKNIGAIDATEVYAQIAGKAPYVHVRKEADRNALKESEQWVTLAAFADALEAAPEVLARFNTARDGYWPDEVNPDTPAADDIAGGQSTVSPIATDKPTNLILYGPPGTGKTWRTAAEAVRLCDGLSADDPLLANAARRLELKQRYDELFGQSRIGFVTFHQNFSYEDFVEGLRPPSGEEASSAGLRLDVHHGVFRELVTLALSGSRSTATKAIDLAGRRFFKMSLGRAGVEDQIFDGAIAGDYLSLGWGGDEDWSDSRYDGEPGYRAIFDRWNQIEPGTSGNSGNISQVWCFRSSMRKGDLVVVSYGNSHVRAIGEVTGAYRFVPTDPFGYYHHRDVKWLRIFAEPIPASAVYERALVQASCYRLQETAVRTDGLSSLLGADGGGAPLPYVLIIDEVNRANVSKVFGELITLIEPDKRLGGANALRVKLPYSQDEFGIPSNLHLVGTMNTADRSIALLDTALRRRFVFREVAPDSSLLPEQVDGVPLRRVLDAINDRIEYLVDRDHRIGHAFFMGDGGRDRDAIDAAMRDKVIPLLQEYFLEDWSRVAAVLGEPEGKGGGFLDCRRLSDPTGGGGEPLESWSVRKDFAPDAYDRLLRGSGAAPHAVPAEEPAEAPG